jgi:arylsulfatase A-like enzyme
MPDATGHWGPPPACDACSGSAHRSIHAVIAALVLGLAIACSAGEERASKAPVPRVIEPGHPLGAVVFLLDTVRADHLSCYGYERPTTPNIDELARKGVLFRQVTSYSPWTLPSVAAVLAGDYPPRVFSADMEMKRSLIEEFATAGYRTAAFTESSFVSRRWGMDRGFHHFYETEYAKLVELSGSDIEGTFESARRWLEENHSTPFFLLIHTYEAHMPYSNRDFVEAQDGGRIGPSYELAFLDSVRNGEVVLTRAEREYIRALYDGDILSTDRYVGRFLEILEDLGLRNRTVVVVTSDHGEEMGDEFELFIGGHGHSMRDNLLMVPLVIHDPTRAFRERRVDVQVRLIDVLPTVADLLGFEISAPIAGRSLVPLMSGSETDHRVAMSGENRHGPARISIRDGSYKYIATIEQDPKESGADVIVVPPVQLYDLRADPSEDVNLAGTRPRVARRLAVALARWYNGLGGTPVEVKPGTLDEKLRGQLRALGYVD